ncbi:MAG: ATP-binding protein [Pseudopedobacter saltans]|uniref:ATP-binding protein n=1 Tax=Pseudopedobacter saltans TaxID=151895 RepID=A0A2W5GFK3_9SPHI|nr:MAG: ATP-binding protein [Pseudopedobacter saltans]
MITINNLAKIYRENIVVDIPQLSIHKGEIIGLVGNNGAGKTTLFRLILDLIRADRGTVIFKENIVAEQSETWKSFVSAYIDDSFLIGYLTPEEYFYFVGKLNNLSNADVDEFLKKYEQFFDGSILNSGKYLRDLSKGNQFKVGIAGCLLQKPEVLVLDEPFANLDPTSQLRLIQLIQKEKEENHTTILVSSHDLNHVTEACDRILLMEKGKIIQDIYNSSDTLLELKSYFQV